MSSIDRVSGRGAPEPGPAAITADPSPASAPAPIRAWRLLLAAWLVALAATLGALFIGEVMGQTPCLLCWYQRIFMFPLALILLAGCLTGDRKAWLYALPSAAVGWAFALYHTLTYIGVITEPIVQCGVGPSCSSAGMSLFGWLPIPVLSLGAFSLITILLVLARRSHP